MLFGIDNNLLSRALDEGLFEPYAAGGPRPRSTTATELDPQRPRHADRPRRRLPQHRQGAGSRRTGIAPPLEPRRPDEPAVPRSSSSSRTPPPRPRGWPSCSPRSPGSARAAGRATGRSCARTRSSSSTAGRRRTRRGSRAPAAARASGRSSSPTRRARRRGDRSRAKPLTDAPTAVIADSCFRQIELAGVLAGARTRTAPRR